MNTTRLLGATLGVAALGAVAHGTDSDPVTSGSATFKPPVRLEAAGTPIEVEAPGYASPAWHDVNGDGRADLVVGQFRDGKMKAFTRNEDGSFAKGEWIKAGEKVAQVPGVW